MKNYDDAFGKFFDRLAAHGINKSNTLFVFTVEEGDHFAGAQPTPAGCDGVTTPCHYSPRGRGQCEPRGSHARRRRNDPVHGSLRHGTDDLHQRQPDSAGFGNQRRSVALFANLTRVNPYTGQPEQLSVAVADTVGMKLLHMVTADPQRTPT